MVEVYIFFLLTRSAYMVDNTKLEKSRTDKFSNNPKRIMRNFFTS